MNVVINRMLACIKAIVADKLIKLIRSNIPNRNIVLAIRFLYLIGCNKDKNQQGIKIKIPKMSFRRDENNITKNRIKIHVDKI